ncbi:MAG: bifunctional hydroxymethylpyrimidine kinase/phosphomethylpyrimidine kinase [Verrucomicrobiales bacterium]|nr:bifunctional hydroxymethylpyrimidine kinase/phosphomethylpyrimidine kinase [Verrucomicrobiales bacterium]
MKVIVAGTVAIDDVKTPKVERTGLMGGSAAYAAMSCSFFATTRIVGIIGKDFPKEHITTLESNGICTEGIERSEGDSFYWSGEYHENMDERTTHDVAINVLEAYEPKIPESYSDTELVLLANMNPRNQIDVLDQCNNAKYSIADTMDIWINNERDELLELLEKIDLLIINESEAQLFMETRNLIRAGKKLMDLGPKNVIIKTGEHGSMLLGKNENEFFRLGAYPLEEVEDPTGAGDCYVGAIAGFIASQNQESPSFKDLKSAMVRGTVMASFNCESFSVEGLSSLDSNKISERLNQLLSYTQI